MKAGPFRLAKRDIAVAIALIAMLSGASSLVANKAYDVATRGLATEDRGNSR